jgi:hypothetical protein
VAWGELPLRDDRFTREAHLLDYGPMTQFTDIAQQHKVRDELRVFGCDVVEVDARSGDELACYRQIEAALEPSSPIADIGHLSYALREIRSRTTAFCVHDYDHAAFGEDSMMLGDLVREAWYHAIHGRLLVTLVHIAEPTGERFGGLQPSPWPGGWIDEL